MLVRSQNEAVAACSWHMYHKPCVSIIARLKGKLHTVGVTGKVKPRSAAMLATSGIGQRSVPVTIGESGACAHSCRSAQSPSNHACASRDVKLARVSSTASVYS